MIVICHQTVRMTNSVIRFTYRFQRSSHHLPLSSLKVEYLCYQCKPNKGRRIINQRPDPKFCGIPDLSSMFCSSKFPIRSEYKKNKRPIQALTVSTWQASGSRLSRWSASNILIWESAFGQSRLSVCGGKFGYSGLTLFQIKRTLASGRGLRMSKSALNIYDLSTSITLSLFTWPNL